MVKGLSMSKVFLLLLPITLFANLISAADFGVADWGATEFDVLNVEERVNRTPSLSENYLIYETTVGPLEDVSLVYWFNQDKLVKGYFLFNDQRFIFSDYVNDYHTIQKAIEAKYGPPDVDEQRWSSSPMEKPDWGNAIAADQLVLFSQWKTNKSLITLQLANNQGNFHHQLVYQTLAEPTGIDLQIF